MPKLLPQEATLELTGQTVNGYDVYRIEHSAIRSDPLYSKLYSQSEAKRQLEELFPGSIVGIVSTKWNKIDFIFLLDGRPITPGFILPPEEEIPEPAPPPAKSPDQISNVELFWISDFGTTEIGGAGTGVSSWEDKIQSELLSQSNGARRPDIVSDILNGQPAIRFNGLQDCLFNGGLPSVSQPFTILVVYTKSDAFTVNDSLFGGTSSFQGDGTNSFAGQGILRMLSENPLGPDAASRAAAIIIDGAGQSKVYWNESANQIFPVIGTGTTAFSNLVVGAEIGNGANAISGDMFEISVFSGEVSVDDINQWGQYVENTYGIPWTGI